MKEHKNLEEIIKLCIDDLDKDDNNVTAILDLIDLKELRNLLNRNKKLEKILKHKNDLIKQADKDLETDYIPKSKVEEKIEKLDKEEQELQNSISDEEREEYSDASISWSLCDIETRRRVLQELLEE